MSTRETTGCDDCSPEFGCWNSAEPCHKKPWRPTISELDEKMRLSAVWQATGTEARVCADIAARQALGVSKYGTTVEANPLTLKQWLQHAYEETLDEAIYMKRAIEEIERKESKP